MLVQPGPKVVTLSRAAADKVESDAKAPALLAAVGYLAGSDWLLMTRPFKEARDFARGVGPKTQRVARMGQVRQKAAGHSFKSPTSIF